MTTAATATEEALANTGAAAKDLNEGQTTAGAPKAPPSGENNKPAPTAEEIAAAKAKEAEALAAAEANEDDETHGTGNEPEKKDEQAAQDWQDQYMQFDDPSANAVVELLKEGNVSVVEANAFFADAIKYGDVTKIDWVGIEKKLGPTKTLLAKNGVQQYWDGALAEQRAIVTDTYEQLGGEANWVTLKNWAQAAEKADTTGKFKAKVDSYRKMIDLGGESRRIAVEQLKAAYDADPNTKGFGTAKITTGDAPAAAVGEPLSRKDYVAALHDAERNKLPAHQIAALHARRKAGKAAGI